MKYVKYVAAIISLLIIVSCATVTNKGTMQNVTVVTPDVEDAKCTIRDDYGGMWYIESTPGTAFVRRGFGPLTIICTKARYKKGVTILPDKISKAALTNIVTYGSGLIVDAVSGAALKYPSQAIVWMESEHWESEVKQQDWEMKKTLYEKQQEDMTHKCMFSEYKNC